MAITLTQLRSFLAVVRTGSVTAAADDLVVTQPSVSAAVSALSRELGVELTQRVGRSIQPSPAGEAFAPFAADVIGLLDQGGRAAHEAADAASSELRLAAVTTAGEHIVPPLIEAFSTLHPDIKLNLDVGNRARCSSAYAYVVPTWRSVGVHPARGSLASAFSTTRWSSSPARTIRLRAGARCR